MKDLQAQLDFSDAVADWLIGVGRDHLDRGNLEDGLKATCSAATVLCRHNRDLCSTALETNLQMAARLLPTINPTPSTHQPPADKTRCLHVLTEALQAGGLTAMAQRWITRDSDKRTHSVALLSQSTPLPSLLRDAVFDSGGVVHTAAPKSTLAQTAAWLRALARQHADCVVLHTGSSDVIAGAAFGIAGGPPVMLVNHTAHTYWTGSSIADLVLNCRGSELEVEWSKTHRGTPRHAALPIPLQPDAAAFDQVARDMTRQHARRQQGLPDGALVLLTVGASFKYFPTAGLDFVQVMERLLQQLPHAYLLVAGVSPDERWRAASRRVGSRIRMLGTVSQGQLAAVRQASDIYVEGFPFGTTTALLEAGLDGLAVVLPPSACPPPYGSDGVALDPLLPRHETLQAYEQALLALCNDQVQREQLAARLADSIGSHHAGSGWLAYVDRAISQLPVEHRVYPLAGARRTPAYIHEYWAEFVSTWNWALEETAELAISHALSSGLSPRLSTEMQAACRRASPFRNGRTIPLPILLLLCNRLLPALPAPLGRSVFRTVSYLSRKALLSRSVLKLAGLLGTRRDVKAWYQEYR